MTDFDNMVSLNYVNNIRTHIFFLWGRGGGCGASRPSLDACLLSTPMWRYFSPNCFTVNLFRCVTKKNGIEIFEHKIILMCWNMKSKAHR
jgi:hypothetical protein